jgi:hypothetical protein
MTDLFREIDEEIRQDRALEIWKKYGNYIIAVALLIVAGTAGYRIYAHFEQQKVEALGLRFQVALEASTAGRSEDAAKEFQAIAAEGAKGYAILARFRAAADLGTVNKPEAIKLYDALAADSSLPLVLQGLARLRAATLAVDDISFDELKTRVEPLLPQGGPWAGLARELLGTKKLAANDYKAAGEYFDAIITDDAAPASVKQRATMFLALVKSSAPQAN